MTDPDTLHRAALTVGARIDADMRMALERMRARSENESCESAPFMDAPSSTPQPTAAGAPPIDARATGAEAPPTNGGTPAEVTKLSATKFSHETPSAPSAT